MTRHEALHRARAVMARGRGPLRLGPPDPPVVSLSIYPDDERRDWMRDRLRRWQQRNRRFSARKKEESGEGK